MDDSKKYNKMEPVFQYINKHYISLDEGKIKMNNDILKNMLETITIKMKETSKLFEKLFSTIFYGGSYYDGLKISNPEEYDYDLLLNIPLYAEPVIIMADTPGFVQVQLKNLEKFKKQPEFIVICSDLEKLLDQDAYFCVDKVKRWMESLLDKTLNKFAQMEKFYTFEVDNKSYYIKKRKAGPAFTLQISDSMEDENKNFNINVDLVPCFVFTDKNWPPQEFFRKNPSTTIKRFFVVPKKPTSGDIPGSDRCWRLSFQEQEKEMIDSRSSLKPALKLLKKLRDSQNHVNISSYFLKTVFLWQVEESSNSFWDQNLSTVFIEMLKRYTARLEDMCIPYFWDERFNLLENIKESERANIKNKLRNIVSDVDRNIHDPTVIAKYLVPRKDLENLQEEITGIKKVQIEKKAVSSKLEANSLDCVDSMVESTNGVTFQNNKESDTANLNSSVKEEISSIQQSVQGLNEKVDYILCNQKELKQLILQIIDKQNDFEFRLSEDNKANSKQRQSDIEQLMLPLAFDGLQLTSEFMKDSCSNNETEEI